MSAQRSPFLEYLTHTDKDRRGALARKVAELDFDSYEGVADGAKTLLIGLLEGSLPPEVSAEGRKALEVMLLALAAKERKENGLAGGASVLVAIMRDVQAGRQPAIEASYTTVDDGVSSLDKKVTKMNR